MIQIQPIEIVYQLILMVGLMIVLDKVLFGPLLGGLAARKRAQQNWSDQTTELQKRINEKEDLIKKELENARNEGLAVKKQLVLEALAKERSMIENARQMATQHI